MASWTKDTFVAQGYRGHNYEGAIEVHVDKKKRGKMPRRLCKWVKRRSAVESGIGHLKNEHWMERNRLQGKQGDMVNAVMSAAGMSFHKLMKRFALLLRQYGAVWGGWKGVRGLAESNFAFARIA